MTEQANSPPGASPVSQQSTRHVTEPEYLLEVRGLSVVFDTPEGTQQVVDRVDLKVVAGRTLGIVGESGSGKSVTCLAVLRLLSANGRVVGGEVLFDGRDLLNLSEAEMARLRGDKIAMVFQDPMTSLNPVHTIGWQISEALHLHQNLSKLAARRRAIELLDLVGIPEPKARFSEYPHQFSGGMNQRAMIAMTIACQPKLLIADEPTTALDVTIQAQILDLLSRLQTEFGTALILITHDLGVIAEVADDVVVMYAGRVVEEAPVQDLFDQPRHPYTLGLLQSLPRVDRSVDRLTAIDGTAPPPHEFVEGCRFEPRCDRGSEACMAGRPDFRELGTARRVACINPVTHHEK